MGIPTAKDDSCFIAFLLTKKDSNKPFLKDARKTVIDIARKYDVNDIDFAKIREYAMESDRSKHKLCNLKDGCWPTKGFLADCKTKQIAIECVHQLQADIAGKYGKKNSKSSFC